MKKNKKSTLYTPTAGSYDPKAETLYVYVGNTATRKVAKTKETTAIADFDVQGNLVGVEILGVKIAFV